MPKGSQEKNSRAFCPVMEVKFQFPGWKQGHNISGVPWDR